VSAVASTIADARRRSLATAQRVEFAGSQYRSDIGWRELARHSAIDAGAAGD
jgi:phosphoribosylamine-glycine ligase